MSIWVKIAFSRSAMHYFRPPLIAHANLVGARVRDFFTRGPRFGVIFERNFVRILELFPEFRGLGRGMGEELKKEFRGGLKRIVYKAQSVLCLSLDCGSCFRRRLSSGVLGGGGKEYWRLILCCN